MKRSYRLLNVSLVVSLVAVGALAWAGTAHAAELIWDANGIAPPYGGTGPWNTTDPNWYNSSTPGYQAWVNGNNDTAVFGTTAGTVTLGEPITVGGLTFNDSAGYVITGNTLTFGVAGSITANVDATIASALAGTGPITKAGIGTLTLSNANAYTGGTIINAGILRAGSTTAFGTATGASLAFGPASTGTVQLNGYSMTVVGLNTDLGSPGTAIVENGAAGAATLTVNNTAANTFAGVFQKGAAGNLALTKTSAGKLTLTGNSGAASIGGVVQVNAGSMEISGGGYLYSGANSTSSIGTGATDSNIAVTIIGTGTPASSTWRNNGPIRVGLAGDNNTVTVSAGGRLWAGGGTDHISIGYNNGSDNNTLTVTGAGSSLVAEDYIEVGRGGAGNTLNVENGATASCFLFWSSGGSGNPSGSSNSTVKIDGIGSTFTVTGSWDIADRGTGNQFNVLNGGTANMTVGGYVGYWATGVEVLVGGAGSVWNTSGIDWANGGNNINATVSNGGRWNANGQITLKNSNAVNLDGGVNGPGELNVQTLNLAAAGGRLNFNGGRLIAQSAGSLVNGSGQINLVGGGYIKTDYTKSIANVIYGVGDLTKEGSGILTLSGNNTYTGATTISAGTLSVSSLANGGSNSSIGASSNAATNLVVGGGTLQYTGATASIDRAFTITAGTTGTFDVTQVGTNLTLPGATGAATSGGLTKVGAGTLVLSGANTYTGATAINVGKLYLNGTNTTSAISVAGGATLGGSGSATSATATVAGTGIVEAGSGGSGTLTLAGLTFSGSGTVKVATIGNYTSSPAVNVTATDGLTVSGAAGSVTLTLSGTAPIGIGTAHLIRYAGAIGGTGFGAFALNTSALIAGPRAVFTLSNPSGYVDVAYDLDYPVWSGAGDGNWITYANATPPPPTTANWTLATSPSTPTNFIAGDAAGFDDTASGTTTVTISAADVAPASVAFNNSTKDYILQGAYGIIGATSLTKSGSGSVTLSTANTFTGDTVLNAGALTLGNTGALAGSTLNYDNQGGTLGFGSLAAATLGGLKGAQGLDLRNASLDAVALTVGGNNQPTTYSGTLSGSGALTKAGAGALVLGGANNYSGGTTINAGTVTVNSGATLGASTGALAVNNPNTGDGTAVVLNLNGSVATGPLSGTIATPASGTNTVTINIAGGMTYTVDQTADGAYAGAIAGGGGLTKTGIGKLTLAGADSYTGNTSINGGTLSVNSLAANNNIAFNNAASLEFTGAAANVRLDDPGSGSNFAIDVTSPTGNLTVSRSAYVNPYNYRAIVKTGEGTLTIANTAWDDGGDVEVDEGTVVLAGNTRIDTWTANVGSITDVKTGATVKLGNSAGGQVYYDSGFHMSGGTFDVNGQNPGGGQNNSVPAIDGSGTITNNSATAGRAVFKINGTKTFSGNIVDGAGVVAVTLTASGGTTPTWILSGNNTYSGTTTVNNGILRAGSTTAFSPNSVYTIGATLDLDGNTSQIAGLAGAGTVRSSVGSAILTVNNDVATSNADYTFGGVLRDGIVPEGGGILGLTKTGSKILTLTGANTYGGGTIVSGGTLLVNNTADSGTGTGSVTVNSGATLGGTGTIAGAVIVNIGGHLAPGAGPLLKLKVGTSVTMTADSIYDWEFDGTNASTVDIQGSLQLDSGWEVALAGSIAPDFGSKFDLFTYTPGSFTGSLTAVIDYSGVTDWPVSWIGQDDGAGKIYLAFGPKPGDANGDGIVDAADYIRLKQYFGQSTANGTNGDFNGDGMVNWTDLQTLMAEFGTRSLGGAPAAPEPGSVMLLMFGAAALLRRRSCLRP